MGKQILFKEVQKQNQKWIWFFVIIVTLTIIFGGVQQIIFNKPFGNHPIPDWGFLIVFIVPLLLFYLLIKSNLYTEITKDYILFHYKPFFRTPKVIKWEQIYTCYVRLYGPIREYRGWGIKSAFNGKNGKAYNVAGNIGIQIELKNGKKILIGTQKAKEAENALKSIFKEN